MHETDVARNMMMMKLILVAQVIQANAEKSSILHCLNRESVWNQKALMAFNFISMTQKQCMLSDTPSLCCLHSFSKLKCIISLWTLWFKHSLFKNRKNKYNESYTLQKYRNQILSATKIWYFPKQKSGTIRYRNQVLFGTKVRYYPVQK